MEKTKKSESTLSDLPKKEKYHIWDLARDDTGFENSDEQAKVFFEGERGLFARSVAACDTEEAVWLVRRKNGEKYVINNPQVTIGRAYDAEIVIAENTTISRHHARIIRRDNGYYVLDLNSANHTYVNDQMIPPGREILLGSGAVLRLANELFEFICQGK